MAKVASPVRSMLRLRSRTINKFKTFVKESPRKKAVPATETPVKASPKSKTIRFSPIKSTASSKPMSPSRLINKKTGAICLVKKANNKYSYFKHLLRSLNKVQMRNGSHARVLPAPVALAC